MGTAKLTDWWEYKWGMTSLGSFSLGPTVSRHASCGPRPSVQGQAPGMDIP